MNDEQNPQAGGSYTRNPDGTLTKQEEVPAIPAPAEQPAAPIKGDKPWLPV